MTSLLGMDRFHGDIIEKTIGKVLEIDVEDDDIGWGRFLRVMIELNLTKPLARV